MRLPLKLLAILAGLTWAVLAGLAIQGRDSKADQWARGPAFGVMLVVALASGRRPKGGDEHETQ
jgi:hypothetical protein